MNKEYVEELFNLTLEIAYKYFNCNILDILADILDNKNLKDEEIIHLLTPINYERLKDALLKKYNNKFERLKMKCELFEKEYNKLKKEN